MKLVTQAVKMFFVEFCANSTIHGIRYFTERRRHWSERCWWIAAFSLSVMFCGTSIRNIWAEWCRTPVTMSITENDTPISAIPFPTVTICPETKAKNEKLDLFSVYHAIRDERTNLTDEKKVRMEALYHLCNFYYLDHVTFGESFMNESIFETIQDIAPKFNDTIALCEWQEEFYPCQDLFTPTITSEGLCFTFNSVNSEEIYTDEMAPGKLIVKNSPPIKHWHIDNGYEKGVREDDYPIRVFNARQGAILTLYPRLFDRDLEYLCRGPFQGFKVILSTPGEPIKLSRHYFRVPLLEQVEALIKPKLVTTSQSLHNYKPNQRQCYFSDERQLRFYRTYSLQGCESECLANFTKIECDCVKFSQPRDRNTRICGAASLKCYRMAAKKLLGEDVIDGLKDKNARNFRKKCNCLPSCTTISYDVETSRARFDFMAAMKAYKTSLDKYSGMSVSFIEISFGDHKVETLKRSALYTYTDFLAVCGGLLGLFLGVSTLSIIEFVYYSTLRLYWTLYQWKTTKNVVMPNPRNISNSVNAKDSEPRSSITSLTHPVRRIKARW